ncbi:MAG: glycosyltransferase family 2 protein [Armatimonadetes bacterium]|nr:MAG: glycosyltransferase family 2 protein [Armatimonadota bacterium]
MKIHQNINKVKVNKTTKPLVSVVIPVFNGALYLEETVTSIQRNTYKNFETILVDDGSTDESKSICKVIAQKHTNVKFYSFPKNKGMDRSLNLALKKARGKYICRINQDDIMLPNRIKTQVEFLEKNPETVAVGSHIKLFDNKNNQKIVKFLKTDEQIKRIWLILSPFSDPSVMYRKEVAIAAGGYKQEFWPADDVHMWYKLGKIGKLANIQKPLVKVRWHDNAGSIKFFRKDAIVTYELHRWANDNIQKAPFFVELFWLGELICGLTLSPTFNWAAYRMLKKLFNTVLNIKGIKLPQLNNALQFPRKASPCTRTT